MLDNCCYNLVKTLYKTSKLAWFLKKHAIPESGPDKHADKECCKAYDALLKDLEKHIDVLNKALE